VGAVVGHLRAGLKGGGVDADARRDAIRAVAESSAVWAAARDGTVADVRDAAERVVADALDA
jgi:hypothetical protein